MIAIENRYDLIFWMLASFLILSFDKIRAQNVYEALHDGSFENYIGISPIPSFTPNPFIANPPPPPPHANWLFLGISPDWFENIKRPLPSDPNASDLITGYVLLGCDNQTSQFGLCFNKSSPTNPITAYHGKYYVGIGGCEGLFQNLATPIPPNAGFTITLRYMPRCPEVLNYAFVMGVANNPMVSNCQFSATPGTDHSSTIDPNAAETCTWNTFSASFINMSGVHLEIVA